MSGLDLASVKRHLGGIDFDEDDAVISDLIAAAEIKVAGYLRRDMAADYPDGWPAPCLQAVRFLVAHYYDRNDGTAAGATDDRGWPITVKTLLEDYRNYS